MFNYKKKIKRRKNHFPFTNFEHIHVLTLVCFTYYEHGSFKAIHNIPHQT